MKQPYDACSDPKYTDDSLFTIWNDEEGDHQCNAYNVELKNKTQGTKTSG